MDPLPLARRALILAGWGSVVVFIWWGVPYVTAIAVDAVLETTSSAALLESALGGGATTGTGQRAAALLTVAFLMMGSFAAAALSWWVLLPAIGVRGPATLLATLMAALYLVTTPYSAALRVDSVAGAAREATHGILSLVLSWLFALALGGVLLRAERQDEVEGLSVVEFRLRTLEDSEDETYVRTLVAICASALAADRCSVFFVHPGEREIRSRSGTGLRADIRVPLEAGFVGHAVRTGETVNVEDAYADRRFDRSADARSGYRTRSVLAVPLRRRHGREVFGVLQALNKRGGAFGRRDEGLLERIAALAGPRLERMHAAEVPAPSS